MDQLPLRSFLFNTLVFMHAYTSECVIFSLIRLRWRQCFKNVANIFVRIVTTRIPRETLGDPAPCTSQECPFTSLPGYYWLLVRNC